ncbi:MAG: hypothetical protein AAFU56_03585, partial [Pseudomonadota bacterium]
MMRIAFVGNSHLAAFMDARAHIEALCLGGDVHFFGLSNQIFFQSPNLNGTALKLDAPPETSRDQMISEHGTHELDFDRYDAVLLTSHAFYFRFFVRDFASVDLLGHPRTRDEKPLISTSCAQDLIRARIRAYAVRLRQFFPQHQNVVVVQAPYPSIEAVNESSELAQVSEHPAVEAIFHTYERILADVCRNQGLSLLQPPE